MITSSLALVLAASALAAPLSNPIHLHPRVNVQDDRITFSLNNDTAAFRDVKIGGHLYTVNAHHSIRVKAPAGTLIYVDSPSRAHKAGDLLLEVTPALADTHVSLN